MTSDPALRALDREARRTLLLDQIRRAERRGISSHVASVMAHVIGTPLNVIAGRAALLRANPSVENCEENSRRIEEQVERLARSIRKWIEFFNEPEPVGDALAVTAVLDEAMAACEGVAALREVTVQRAEGVEGAVEGVPVLVVLTSLLSLSMRLARAGETLQLRASESRAGCVLFEVTLPGLGDPPKRLDRLDLEEGVGRERAEALHVLSACFGIAKRHGASLVLGQDGQGVTIARLDCVLLSVA